MNNSAAIFLQFLRRDIYIHAKNIRGYIINHVIIQPLTFAFCFAYLEQQVTFGTANPLAGTLLFSGSMLIAQLVLTYKTTIGLLYDLENERFIDYQISILNPRLVLLERIVFTSLFAFILTIPFFPIGKLVAGKFFVTTNTSWIKLYCIMYLSALCCSTYNILAASALKNTRTITNFWTRVNMPLMNLGGLWIPLAVFKGYSPILGYLILLNPFIYITDGVRSAILGGPNFMPFWRCSLMLLLFSVVFTFAAWHFFKKRVDHI